MLGKQPDRRAAEARRVPRDGGRLCCRCEVALSARYPDRPDSGTAWSEPIAHDGASLANGHACA
jgi:hypothetical protein